MYSRKEIPFAPSEVSTPLKLKKWHYLDCVTGKIAANDAVSIDVLIGANCTKALEPIDFIARKNAVLVLWRLFWVGVLWDPLEVVAKGMM